MKIILLGAPGSGKGTQASLLEEAINIPKISTGDLLRKEVRMGTEFGKEIKSSIESGQLVSDLLVMELIKSRIKQADCSEGYILDGFPRTASQAKSLAQNNIKIDFILNLFVEEQVIIQRISGRRIHKNSGRTYHNYYNPPAKKDIDDITGEALSIREDDKEETVRKRIKIYNQEINGILDYYSKINKEVINLDGNRSAEEIKNMTIDLINKNKG